jgi:hypothetical protein
MKKYKMRKEETKKVTYAWTDVTWNRQLTFKEAKTIFENIVFLCIQAI